jgi:hypothetical protein
MTMSEAVTVAAAFADGDRLEWHSRSTDDRSLTVRPVIFRGLIEAGVANVAFGLRHGSDGAVDNLFRVPVAELKWPASFKPPPYHPASITPPRPPTAPSPDQIERQIAAARADLREAHAKAAAARSVVETARGYADRARQEVATTRAALRQILSANEAAAQRVADAIKRGETPSYGNGGDHEAARARVAAAEAAQASFDAELAAAGLRLGNANTAVRQSAAAVIGALVERECEALRALESRAAARRADLVAVASWWPDPGGPLRLAPAAASYIANRPAPVEPVGDYAMQASAQARRSAPWRETFDRLVASEIEADLAMEA